MNYEQFTIGHRTVHGKMIFLQSPAKLLSQNRPSATILSRIKRVQPFQSEQADIVTRVVDNSHDSNKASIDCVDQRSCLPNITQEFPGGDFGENKHGSSRSAMTQLFPECIPP